MVPDLRGVLAAFVEADVAFVVVGGIAVLAHGHVRATADVDVVPEPSNPNIERLVVALSQIRATLPVDGGRPFDPAEDAQALRRGRNLTADSPLGALDVIQRAPGLPPYAELAAEAIDTDVLGLPVKVCSLRHLRAMKAASGRLSDRADLEALPEA